MQTTPSQTLRPTPWRGGKRWVYSITFDEALADLHRFAIPLLEEFHCPGHLEVVVGQMGAVRRIFDSSFNGMRHMSAAELRAMLAKGWGVGNHTWSHTMLNLANLDRELDQAKQVLEEALGSTVTIYCSPGNNANMSDEILEACRALGYLGAMAIYEALNRPTDPDLMWLNRVYLHENGPITHDAEFDPYRKILHAARDGGWIIDYCHCPLEQALHPRKDCSAGQLRQRLTAVQEYGQADVWLAKIEDVVDYRYMYRCLQIRETGQSGLFALALDGLPDAVQNRRITLQLPEDTAAVDLQGMQGNVYRRGETLLVDVDVEKHSLIRIVRQPQETVR